MNIHYLGQIHNLGQNRPLPIGLNKKVIGLTKDELGCVIMTEFIALRPKLYSYKVLNGAESKKCKGIKKCVVKKTLTFEDYKSCLFNPDTIIDLSLCLDQ